MSTQIQPVRSDQSGFNIKDFIFKYIRFLPLFIFSVILAYATAFLYLRYTTVVYRSTGTLILKDNNSGMGASDPRFQQLFIDDRSKNIQNEIEYLKSRGLMERVVQNLDLNFSYYAKGKIKQENVYRSAPFRVEVLSLKDSSAFQLSIHFQNDNNFQVGLDKKIYSFGQTISNEHGVFRLQRSNSTVLNNLYVVRWAPASDIASSILPQLAVAPKQSGSILMISLESDNAALCSDIINRLMIEYQRSTVEDKNATTRQTIDFLDGRLRIVGNELDSVTSRLLAFQQANNINGVISETGEGSANPYTAKADAADEKSKVAEMQVYRLNLIRDYLGDGNNAFNLVPSSLTINDATLSTLVSAYNVTQLERKNMVEGGIAPENPRVKQKEEYLQKLRTNIFENVRNLLQAANYELAKIRQEQNSYNSQMRSMPAKMQELAEIKRQQGNKQAIYNFLMEKREEASISLAATISNIKVLERAVPELSPIKPNRSGVRSVALLIGLLIPALFIFILELLDDKIVNRTDIEKAIDVPILGEVGHSADTKTLVVLPKSRGFVAEQFRIIRSNLQFILGTEPKPVIMVTSSFSGEGKSFISTNLGAVHALAGKKTIILEFDIRKPKILSGLGMSKKPGFTNFMMGKAPIEELPIRVDDIDNLYVLPCGPIPPNPAEILLEDKMNELFVYLKENFDVIVMDTAPVGIVSDALALSKFATCCIYITRQGVTHKRQLNMLNDLYTDGKLNRVSIIFNDIKIKTGYGYYYQYGRYGYSNKYGYGYGYGYFDDAVPEPGFFGRIFRKNKKKASAK
jgi:tyrosine-protein kinase Etk/Wzc